jgi:hypothetical protein
MPEGPHQNLRITFLSQNRRAECVPNPKYPDGIVVDTGERPACAVDLPYPAPCVGAWLVMCDRCSTSVVCTAAGRPDDPKAILVPCKTGKATSHVK